MAGYRQTYVAGYGQIYVAGYRQTYMAGYRQTYVTGYRQIYVAGYRQTYVVGYRQIYVVGYRQTYVAGYRQTYVALHSNARAVLTSAQTETCFANRLNQYYIYYQWDIIHIYYGNVKNHVVWWIRRTPVVCAHIFQSHTGAMTCPQSNTVLL